LFLCVLLERFLKKEKIHFGRLMFLLSFFLFCSVLLFARMMYVSVLPTKLREKLLKQREQQTSVSVSVASSRLSLLDRQKRLLALQIQKPSFFSFRQKIQNPQSLSKFLNLSPQQWNRLMAKKQKGFVWLERLSSKPSCDFPKKFVGQLFCIYEPARSYPWGESFAPLVGRVGVDNQGLVGLEWFWEDKLLRPGPAQKYRRNAKGELSVVPQSLRHESPLSALSLSFDAVLQDRLFKEMKQEFERIDAQEAGGLLVDSQTGEVLSLVSLSSTDRLGPLSDHIEWGSLMKPFLVACALEKGVVSPNEIFVGGASRSFFGGKHIIRDTHPRESWTLLSALRDSSNLVMVELLERLSVETYWDCLDRYGFFGPSPVVGSLSASRDRGGVPQDPWLRLTVAFGQGVSSTLAHYVRAFLSILSDKPLAKFSFSLSRRTALPFQDPLSEETRLFLKQSLEAVVKSGTARVLSPISLLVYGKTSTAQVFNLEKNRYAGQLLGFVGAFGQRPYVLGIYFLKKEEEKGLYGGNTAAAVFRRWLTSVKDYPYFPDGLYSSETELISMRETF
jgi:cell division protein FtsI (penicillin-binding protein 3)